MVKLRPIVAFIETWLKMRQRVFVQRAKHFQSKSKTLILIMLTLKWLLWAEIFIWHKLDQCNYIGVIVKAKLKNNKKKLKN